MSLSEASNNSTGCKRVESGGGNRWLDHSPQQQFCSVLLFSLPVTGPNHHIAALLSGRVHFPSAGPRA